MIIITAYRLDEQGGFYFVKSLETSGCPICAELLTIRGLRERVLINGDGDKGKLMIRRLFCCTCERIHHELPDCVVPYKRHCAETIEKITAGKSGAVPCNDKVIAQILSWWAMVLPYFSSIMKSLAEKYSAMFSDAPAFKETVRAVTNSNNWVFSRTICTRLGAMSV